MIFDPWPTRYWLPTFVWKQRHHRRHVALFTGLAIGRWFIGLVSEG